MCGIMRFVVLAVAVDAAAAAVVAVVVFPAEHTGGHQFIDKYAVAHM